MSLAADDDNKKDFDEIRNREMAHFWLCGRCSTTMTLVLEPLGGIQLVPLEDTIAQSVASPLGEEFRESLSGFQRG
jgi:hypothetical protein